MSSNCASTLRKYYKKVTDIFSEYQMSLQQFASNCSNIQTEIDDDFQTSTDTTIKFFGMQWNRKFDTLSPFPIILRPYFFLDDLITEQTKRDDVIYLVYECS